MEFDQVNITITNGDGEVYAIHEIADKDVAQLLLNQIDPVRHDPPADIPESAGEINVIDDMTKALSQFAREKRTVRGCVPRVSPNYQRS